MGGENGYWFQSTLYNIIALKEDSYKKGRTKVEPNYDLLLQVRFKNEAMYKICARAANGMYKHLK